MSALDFVRYDDPLDILLDNRSLIEIGRHEMRRGANQLHPALMRLMIRPGALEPGQEGVVDVDAASGQLVRQIV